MPTAHEREVARQFGEQPLQEFSLYGGKVVLLYDADGHKYYIDGPFGRELVYNATTVLTVVDKSFMLINWALRACTNSIEDALGITYSADGEVMYGDDLLTYTTRQLSNILETGRKAHNKLKTDAASIGSMAHNWLEQYWKKRMDGLNLQAASLHLFPADLQAQSCIKAALAWVSEHNVKPICFERKVYSIEDNACGTLDLVAMVDGLLSIVDYKTSNAVYNEHRFQTAFYRSAYQEETGSKVDQHIILRLGKDDGAFEPHVFNSDEVYESDLTAFRAALILYDRIQTIKTEGKETKRIAREVKKVA